MICDNKVELFKALDSSLGLKIRLINLIKCITYFVYNCVKFIKLHYT